MAEIAPFRGVLYDPARVPVDKVLAPPYDVISEDGRKQLEAEHANNVVRLILPQPDGPDGDSRYARAARDLEAWLAEGVLKRDAQPALYRYAQTFTHEGETVTRKGFIGLCKLARFDEGVVKPHERTLSGPKADRLKLKRATRCHLSQVFGLYSDPARETDAAFAAVDATAPLIGGKTMDGVTQALWRVDDAAAVAQVARVLRDRAVYIADGHHRYETMLALREELRAANPKRPARSAAEFGTLFLCNMDDPSLRVFAIHRLLHSLPGWGAAALIEKARAWFEVEAVGGDAADAAHVREGLKRRAGRGPTFAMVLPGDADVRYFTLRAGAEREVGGPEVARRLDVSVLHALVLERLLGIDRAAQEKQTNLEYAKDTGEALLAAKSGKYQAGFLMNPTRVEQVRAVADAGEVMPQKSTFFYPKLASGVVMNRIDPAEEIVDPLR